MAMKQVVIENPVINSPFDEPQRYFIPIAKPKKKGKQAYLPDTEWTQERVKPNDEINRIRAEVAKWRKGGYPSHTITKTTARLLEYWQRPDREKKLFFCQIEALETAIFLTEVAKKFGLAWVENGLRQANAMSNPLLFRIAFKMATGSGKTVVMAMLIAWHTLNKLADPKNTKFWSTANRSFLTGSRWNTLKFMACPSPLSPAPEPPRNLSPALSLLGCGRSRNALPCECCSVSEQRALGWL
jgi:type III restriction enzyme